MLTKVFWAVIVAACASGGAAPWGEPRAGAYPFLVEAINERSEVARVEERATGRVVRVWPGQRAALALPDVGGQRRLLVEISGRTYASQEFAPSEVTPCWRLIIDNSLVQLRGGPWPYDCGPAGQP